MSLINQMLKDLDQRQGTVGGSQPLSADVRISSPQRSSNPLVLVALVTVAVGVAVFAWMQWSKPAVQVTAPQVAHAPAAPAAVAAKPAEAAAPAPAQAAAPATVASAPTPMQSGSAQVAAAKPEQAAHKEAAKLAEAHKAIAPVSTVRAEKVPVEKQQLASPGTETATSKQAKPADQAPSFKVVSPAQKSDNLYRQAVAQMQKGRTAEAQQTLAQALKANAGNHPARLLLASSQADLGRKLDATALLQEGLALSPGNSAFSMALARLHASAGARSEALATMERGLEHAAGDPDYHAYYAALLQSQERHAEAIQHYLVALRSNPAAANWLVGIGISLQAENQLNDAAEAFQRAIDTGDLALELAQFADERLKQIRQR